MADNTDRETSRQDYQCLVILRSPLPQDFVAHTSGCELDGLDKF